MCLINAMGVCYYTRSENVYIIMYSWPCLSSALWVGKSTFGNKPLFIANKLAESGFMISSLSYSVSLCNVADLLRVSALLEQEVAVVSRRKWCGGVAPSCHGLSVLSVSMQRNVSSALRSGGGNPRRGDPSSQFPLRVSLPQQLHIAHWNHMQTRHFACVRLFILLRWLRGTTMEIGEALAKYLFVYLETFIRMYYTLALTE